MVLGRLHHSIGNLNSLYGIVWFEYAIGSVLIVLGANLRGVIFRGLAYGQCCLREDMGEKGLV